MANNLLFWIITTETVINVGREINTSILPVYVVRGRYVLGYVNSNNNTINKMYASMHIVISYILKATFLFGIGLLMV